MVFFIPGSVTGAITDSITGDKGEHCVGSNTKVGDTIRLPDGSYGKVKYLSTSNSSRCTNKLPIRALIDVSNSLPPTALSPITNKTSFDPPTPVTQILLPDGTWGYPATPDVMPDGSWEDSAQPLAKNPISAVDEAPAPPVSSELSSSPSPSQSASPAQRLRELNALFKEGLIDKNEYAEKKRKILDAM